MAAFILLCVAVLIESAPPIIDVRARWVAFALALVALLLMALGRSNL